MNAAAIDHAEAINVLTLRDRHTGGYFIVGGFYGDDRWPVAFEGADGNMLRIVGTYASEKNARRGYARMAERFGGRIAVAIK